MISAAIKKNIPLLSKNNRSTFHFHSMHMKNLFFNIVATGFLIAGVTIHQPSPKKWISLFDGKTFTNWKVGNNAGTFTIEHGAIVAHGPVAHLFYMGDVADHNFKNFEFKADVMTTPGSNSGIYFHTTYQESSWPQKGYEAQVNNSQSDWRRTGSLYGIQDVKEVYVKDNTWFTEHIKVQGKRIIIKINNKTVVDYTEPDNIKREKGMEGRLLSRGTFALQGHDPGSKVYFKNIMVKMLPD